jgi:hypothetical protein
VLVDAKPGHQEAITMLVPQFFAEAEIDYRHEELMRQVRQTPNPRRPLGVKVREVRERWARRSGRRGAAIRQPMPAPHHMRAAG